MVQCPKCHGDAYLIEEELVKVLENTEPMKVIAKATYQCKSCLEKFTRLVYENLEAKKKQEETLPSGQPTSQPSPQGQPFDTLRFLDNV